MAKILTADEMKQILDEEIKRLSTMIRNEPIRTPALRRKQLDKKQSPEDPQLTLF